jgi:hypothetical protein
MNFNFIFYSIYKMSKKVFGQLNNADYLNEVDKFLTDVYNNFDESKSKLKYYQKLSIEYFLAIKDNSNIRGFVLNYQTGLGKTFVPIAITDALLNYGNIYFISPKTLAANLPKNIDKYIQLGLNITPADILRKKIKMINISSTLVKKLGENEYDQLEGGFVKQLELIKGGIIIVDEAHKLFQMIANGSAVGKEFYDIIRNSPPALKILFMTGSILTSDPFECVPAFNMLVISDPKIELFPSNREDFYNMFIDMENFEIKNKNYFQNRIMGLMSSVKNIESLEGYPTFNELEIIRVTMTPAQYKLYDYYRELEKKELNNVKMKNIINNNAFGKKDKGYSTFRVYTRQISNFAPPESYFTEFIKTGEDNTEYIKNNIDKIQSPKFEMLEQLLTKHSGDFGLIYSQFTGLGGLKSIKYKLLKKGYELFNKDYPRNDGVRRFCVIDGDTKLDDIAYYLDVSASIENMNGNIISFILLSVAGVTGLDFANAKYEITFEKHYSPAVQDQFDGRVRRYLSLQYHPKSEWFISRYVLIAVVPDEFKDKHPTSTDEDVMNIEIRKRKILEQFNNAMEETCIECALFMKLGLHKNTCKRCEANGNRLYTNSLSKDIKTTDPCITNNNNFKKFKYNNETYYYDGKKIYNKNKSPLSILDPIFTELLEIIQQL